MGALVILIIRFVIGFYIGAILTFLAIATSNLIFSKKKSRFKSWFSAVAVSPVFPLALLSEAGRDKIFRILTNIK